MTPQPQPHPQFIATDEDLRILEQILGYKSDAINRIRSRPAPASHSAASQQRCETCRDLLTCKPGEILYAATRRKGCASHSSAQQQRIEQVINILEMQIGCSNMLWEDGGDSKEDAYHQLVDECRKALALLQAGGKE